MRFGKRLFPAFGLLAILTASSCVKDRLQPTANTGTTEQKVIHYWNFNDSLNLLVPTSTIGGGAITIPSTYDFVNPGSALNARNSDDSGVALRVRNPSTDMTWRLSTKGYKTPTVSFAVMRTGSGAQQNIITYTTDGTTYRSDSLSLTTVNVTESWQLIVLDFSQISSSANNPVFAVKIAFANGNTGASGNDRYDNLVCMAEPLATAPPVSGDSVLHRWNFSAAGSDMSVFTQPTSTLGGGALAYTASWDTSATGSTLNAGTGGTSGRALKLKNPSGNFTLSVPTTGFKNVILKYATARNPTGRKKPFPKAH